MVRLFKIQLFIVGCLCATGTFAQVVASSSINSSERVNQLPLSKSDQFAKDLDLYIVDPSWILPFFLSCSLQEFDKVWPIFVAFITKSSSMQTGTGGTKQNSLVSKELLIASLQIYDQFLRDTVIDIQQQRLFLSGNKVAFYTKQSGIITLFQYWQAKQLTTYQDFYAFYFDVVAAAYVQAITNASLQTTLQEFELLYKKAFGFYRQLSSLFMRLQGGLYDQKYAHHLARYGGVFVVLEEQRNAFRGQ